MICRFEIIVIIIKVASIFLLFNLNKIVHCQNAARLLNQDLFLNYDSQSRPVKNVNLTTDICVGLYILQIVDLSEKNQVFFLNNICRLIGIFYLA
jgi:hypothetical protein